MGGGGGGRGTAWGNLGGALLAHNLKKKAATECRCRTCQGRQSDQSSVEYHRRQLAPATVCRCVMKNRDSSKLISFISVNNHVEELLEIKTQNIN